MNEITGRQSERTPRYRREVVGVFQSSESLEKAISALGSAGWDRAEMSLLGHAEAIAPGKTAHQLANDPNVEREAIVSDTDERQGRTLAAGIGGVVAAFAATGATILTGGGTLAAIVGAHAFGGGATVVIEAVGRFLGGAHAQSLQEQVDRGGILLWVVLRGDGDESKARAVMTAAGATATYAHDVGQPELPLQPGEALRRSAR